jgi:hypothetical protein
MTKIISLILLAAGVVLIIHGVHASDSLGSDFSRFFHGGPTNKTTWLMIGGIVLTAVGAGGLMRGSNSF